LDDVNDLHRLEIAKALANDTRVIPVLVGGAIMPQTADLPGEIQGLARRNAFEVSDRRFNQDVERLCRTVDRVAAESTMHRVAKAAPEVRRTIDTSRQFGADDVRSDRPRPESVDPIHLVEHLSEPSAIQSREELAASSNSEPVKTTPLDLVQTSSKVRVGDKIAFMIGAVFLAAAIGTMTRQDDWGRAWAGLAGRSQA
jgi:hypothetical protein